MVIGVQAFDALAQHGGGEAILPLDALFKGIATIRRTQNTGGSMPFCSPPSSQA